MAAAEQVTGAAPVIAKIGKGNAMFLLWNRYHAISI